MKLSLPDRLQRLDPRRADRPQLVQRRDLENLSLVVRDIAESHASIPAPDPFPEFHEETKGGRAVVVRFVEVKNDTLDAAAVQQVKNLPRPLLNPLVFDFPQIHGWDDDDCVVLLLDLEDSVCDWKSCLRHAISPRSPSTQTRPLPSSPQARTTPAMSCRSVFGSGSLPR